MSWATQMQSPMNFFLQTKRFNSSTLLKYKHKINFSWKKKQKRNLKQVLNGLKKTHVMFNLFGMIITFKNLTVIHCEEG